MDKTTTLYDDIIDAFRLALSPFQWEKKGESYTTVARFNIQISVLIEGLLAII
jgi:hypothetical protein